MHLPVDGSELVLTDDQLYQTRQALKNVFMTIHVYLSIHAYIKVDALRRSNRLQHLPPNVPVPHTPAHVSYSKVRDLYLFI